MKCAKCGAELKEGCIYCSVCGYEAQVVNEFSVLEEDYLKSLLSEENRKDTVKEQPKRSKNKKKKKTPQIALIAAAVCVVLFAAGAVIYVNYKNSNSYDYQMEMAEKERTSHQYADALSYYKNALSLSPDDLAAREAMAEIYMVQKDYDSALVLYMEILTMDAANKEAYEGLIGIYEARGEYDKIKSLAQDVTDEEILKLFDGYLVAEPVFYPDAGTYDVYTTVTIFSVEDFEIYYTLDGSDPATDGILYTSDGIELDETGTYTISAACKNEKGIFSDVVTVKYKTQARVPDYPEVTPDGGTFTEQTFVTLTAQDGCSIYYTWDGTAPTTSSALYTEPIEVPEGNNILSIIVINDKSGLMSGIYRANFIYQPTAQAAE